MICDLGHKPTWGGGEGIFIILPHPTVNEQLPATRTRIDGECVKKMYDFSAEFI